MQVQPYWRMDRSSIHEALETSVFSAAGFIPVTTSIASRSADKRLHAQSISTIAQGKCLLFWTRKPFMLDLPDGGIFEFLQASQKKLALDQENFLFL